LHTVNGDRSCSAVGFQLDQRRAPPRNWPSLACPTIPPPMSATLQREHWNGQLTRLGELFRISEARAEKQLRVCDSSGPIALGWELRLEINGDLQRSEVFRSQDDVLTAGET
jgi:hypothetical protein